MLSKISTLSRATVIATAFCIMLLAGCGGGGSDGGSGDGGIGNSLPPISGPGDAENFFPTDVGSSWNYFASETHAGGTPYTFIDAVSVTGSKSVNGTLASVFAESGTSASVIENYYYKNAGGIAYLGNSDPTDTITPALAPYLVALFPVTAGDVAKFKKDINLGDLDGDGAADTGSATLTSSVLDFEALDLAIGQFPRSLKTTLLINGSVELSQTKTVVPFTSTVTKWSVPGIGVVKSSSSTTSQGNSSTQEMEVRGYTVNGVAHGFDLPFKLASDVTGNTWPPEDHPALATDGHNFLAVSEDASGLYGLLFDASGATIKSVRLGAAAGPAYEMAGFDGVNYWVIFTPYSNVTSGSVTTCLAQRVSQAGALIDATPIPLVSAGSGYSSITSAGFSFGGSNGLVAFSEYNNATNQHELHGILFNPDGTTVGSGDFPIASDNSTHLSPAVGFDGTNFLVTWEQLATSGATVRSIYGVRVSPAGVVLDASPIAIATGPNGQSNPSVAFDGSNYLVVWLDLRNGTTDPNNHYPDVYGGRVSTAGALLDGPATAGGIRINGGGKLQRSSVRAAFLGGEYLVTWALIGYAAEGLPGVQAARLSTSGTLLSGANAAISVSGPSAIGIQNYNTPVIATGATRGAIIWFDNQTTTTLLGVTYSVF